MARGRTKTGRRQRPDDSAETEAPDQEMESYLAALAPEDSVESTGSGRRFGGSQVYQLRLPLMADERLKELAAKQGTSPSALAKEWVMQHLHQEKPDQEWPQQDTSAERAPSHARPDGPAAQEWPQQERAPRAAQPEPNAGPAGPPPNMGGQGAAPQGRAPHAPAPQATAPHSAAPQNPPPRAAPHAAAPQSPPPPAPAPQAPQNPPPQNTSGMAAWNAQAGYVDQPTDTEITIPRGTQYIQ